MKGKIGFWLMIAAAVSFGSGFRFLAPSESPFPDEELKEVMPYPSDPSRILVASESGIFVKFGSQNWKRVISFEKGFRGMAPHPVQSDKIIFWGDQGVLEGDLKTGRVRWLFREKNSRNQIYTLEFHPHDFRQMYLGTEQGLFRSADGGETWTGSHRWPETERVEFAAAVPTSPPMLLLANGKELFFSKDGGRSFESGFSIPILSNEESEDGFDGEEISFSIPRFTSFAFSSEEPSRIWIGTGEGIFESRDGGVIWTVLPSHGLEDLKIHDLAFSDRSGLLFAASSRGVFQFNLSETRWDKLPVGAVKPPISITLQFLWERNEEKLLIVSGSRVFEWPIGAVENPSPVFIPSPERTELFQKLTLLEPPIREIQKRAIRYANVGNGKIARWHWGSRMRAFVPRFTFGKDFSLSENVDIDRGSTNDPDRFIRGPDDIDRGWDLGLTWELGDFLYSTAQASIDSRAKALVELRDSILNEVTRIYFERRRVLAEIIFSGPQMTPEEHLNLSLRLEELTAQIDALTDGFFSERLEAVYQNHPELNRLFSSPISLPEETLLNHVE